MDKSVLDVVSRIKKHLPTFLDQQCIRWCERVAAHTPASARSHYFECRLGASSQIDFMSGFHDKRAAKQYRTQFAEGAEGGVTWRNNFRLLDEWAREDSLMSAAPYLWFEHDAPERPTDSHLEASPSIGLEPLYYMRHWRGAAGISPRARQLIAEALRVLVPAVRVEQTATAISHCLDAMPQHGAVGYLSVMTARKPVTVKLFLLMGRNSVASFLERCGWPGDRALARALIDDLYAPAIRTAYLDVTIADGVASRLGIATSQFHHRELAGSSQADSWLRLPEMFNAEANELRRWPRRWEVTEGEQPPLSRWLDIKAVLENREIQYKAYLGFMQHLPRP